MVVRCLRCLPVSQVSGGSKVSQVSSCSKVSSPVSRVSSGSKVSSGSEVTQVSPPLSQVSTPIYVNGADHILSNFYSCTLIYQGVTFASSEHLYQYRKAVEHSVCIWLNLFWKLKQLRSPNLFQNILKHHSSGSIPSKMLCFRFWQLNLTSVKNLETTFVVQKIEN